MLIPLIHNTVIFNKKAPLNGAFSLKMAEEVGFEPTDL
jgi:hypothetical protein